MSGEEFDEDAMLDFLNRSVKAVGNARRRSRLFQRKIDDYEDMKHDLIELITNKFDIQCDVHFYGSRVIGIGNFKSDVDIYVELNDDYSRGTSLAIQRQIMAYISGVFRKGECDFSLQKVPLYNATVPLIFCFYHPKRLRSELTFNDGIGVENSFLLRHFFEIQPAAVNLFHFLRIWFTIADMRFKNYQILMLVVFFLQSQSYLPNIGRVQQGLRAHRIRGWNVAFNPKRNLKNYGCYEMEFFLDHAIDFFQFYGRFNFARNVIIPHLGKSVLRENYANSVSCLPGDPDGFRMDRPMAVTSLLTTDYNVTYNVGAERVRRFIRLCQYSEGLLENNQ